MLNVKHIVGVETDFANEFQALPIVPFQNDRRFRRQFAAANGPDGVVVRHAQRAVGTQPAEFGIVRRCRFGRSEEFNVGAVVFKGLFVFFEEEIVETGSFDTDGTGQGSIFDVNAGILSYSLGGSHNFSRIGGSNKLVGFDFFLRQRRLGKRRFFRNGRSGCRNGFAREKTVGYKNGDNGQDNG